LTRVRATPHRGTGLCVLDVCSFPGELAGILSPAEFEQAITRVNDVLALYWPCDTCYFFGYTCSICTLGLSFCFPKMCIAHAERYAQQELYNLNHSRRFEEIGMVWELHKTCLNSWIEIECPDPTAI
jgi:hypothetical protein